MLGDIFIDLAWDRIRLVNHDRYAQKFCCKHCRKARIAAFAEHDIRIQHEYFPCRDDTAIERLKDVEIILNRCIGAALPCRNFNVGDPCLVEYFFVDWAVRHEIHFNSDEMRRIDQFIYFFCNRDDWIKMSASAPSCK